jgi:hypothetical protein
MTSFGQTNQLIKHTDHFHPKQREQCRLPIKKAKLEYKITMNIAATGKIMHSTILLIDNYQSLKTYEYS